MALYNHIKNGDIDCIHEVLLANKFGSAEKIEQQVNDAMVGKNTIFLLLVKCLRSKSNLERCSDLTNIVITR